MKAGKDLPPAEGAVEDPEMLGRRGLMLTSLVLLVAACAPTAQTVRSEQGDELQAYLAQVQTLSEDAHPVAPSSTEMRYAFNCGDQRHTFGLRTGGRPHVVTLDEISGAFGDVSADDRARVQAELDQFDGVKSIMGRCASSGRYGFLITGRQGGETPSGASERSSLIWFHQGRMSRVVTY